MIRGSSLRSIPHKPCLPCLKRQMTTQPLLHSAGVDELQWREAMQRAGGEGNARNLWPVLALGTKDLLARKHAQVWLRSVTHTSCWTPCGQCSFGCEVAPIEHSCSLSVIVRVMARVQIDAGTGNKSWIFVIAALVLVSSSHDHVPARLSVCHQICRHTPRKLSNRKCSARLFSGACAGAGRGHEGAQGAARLSQAEGAPAGAAPGCGSH